MSLVGENIRRLRKRSGMKAKTLARLAGLSTVSMIELGYRRGCIESLERIAKALGVPMAALFSERRRHSDSPRAS